MPRGSKTWNDGFSRKGDPQSLDYVSPGERDRWEPFRSVNLPRHEVYVYPGAGDDFGGEAA